jgi:histidinol-phosphate aminotransferase
VSIRTSPRIDAMPHYAPGLTTAEVLARFGLASAVKLASNESPFPPVPEVTEAVIAGVATLNRYPDGPARTLRAELADRHGVQPEQVVVGNGSCELLLLAGQALLDPGTTLIHADPSFALYPHMAAAAGAEALAVPLADDDGHDLDHMAALADERTRLAVVCNPNNPTGVYRSADAIEDFLDRLPADLPVLVDEAYNEFVAAPDRGRVLSLARSRPNLLVTRTFSKAHGLCGLRVGYAVGGAGWVRAIDAVRQPFNTNALAQAAALQSFRRQSELDRRVRATVQERAILAGELAQEGWELVPSEANFLLARPPAALGHGPEVHLALLRLGVIVRDGASLGCPGRLRISVGTADEHAVFRAARAALGAAGVPSRSL